MVLAASQCLDIDTKTLLFMLGPFHLPQTIPRCWRSTVTESGSPQDATTSNRGKKDQAFIELEVKLLLVWLLILGAYCRRIELMEWLIYCWASVSGLYRVHCLRGNKSPVEIRQGGITYNPNLPYLEISQYTHHNLPYLVISYHTWRYRNIL
jgi:hypothetical protein